MPPPTPDIASWSQIGVEEVASRTQHACHLGQEAGEMRVGARGFDVDHCVERAVGKWHLLCVAVHEVHIGQSVSPPTEIDGGLVQVQPGVVRWPQGAREVGRSAAVTTTNLQYPFAAQAACVATRW